VAESGERTDAEREAARLERERRRAQQREDEERFGERGVNGHAQSEAGADRDDGDNTEPEGAAELDHGEGEFDHGAGEFDHGERDFDHGEGKFDRGVDEFDESDEQFEADQEFEAGEDRFDDGHEPEELPSGTRRASHRERLGAARLTPRRPPKRPGRKRKHSLAGRLLSVLAIVAAVAAIWFLFELFQPFQSTGHGRVTVTIPAHASAGTIGKLLERNGVISSSFFFEVRALLAGERSDLRSGTYHLRRGMSYGDILKILTTAPPAARVTNLTIVEGKTRKEVDTLLRSQGVHGSYLAATRRSRLLDPRRYGAPRHTTSLEGFLFPATYQLREPIGVSALVSDQLHTFRQRFGRVNLSYARRKHLSPYDVLIIASMVEAEAATPHDRPLIASVIYNRLARGMPLQIDATTRYATGNYTNPLTDSQLNSRSPYNTRIRKGLTPGPINSPGLPSIQAAAHPASTNYLYYVVKPCGNGEHAFASTYSKFQAEVRRYQTARSSRGGRSPEHC
jgi:UPF0755 protein